MFVFLSSFSFVVVVVVVLFVIAGANVIFIAIRFRLLTLGRFNWAARKLHRRLQQLGANEFYARGEGDEQHDEG